MNSAERATVVFKHLQKTSIHAGLLNEFAHCQEITKKWVKQDEVWTLADAFLLREWSDEKRVWVTEYMCEQIDRGGVVVGAFSDDRIIGFCCVDGVVSGSSAKYANLTMLFVDDYWKRHGIGMTLFRKAQEHARRLGAEKIFISAIPSAETVAFYQKMGCIDAAEIVDVFVEAEDDRYLECGVMVI